MRKTKKKERERKRKGNIMIRTKGCGKKKRGTRERKVGKERKAVKGREGKKVVKKE